nr:MAG: hypothetical protein DIU78_07275 [Pseudomonadota bacterium]
MSTSVRSQSGIERGPESSTQTPSGTAEAFDSHVYVSAPSHTIFAVTFTGAVGAPVIVTKKRVS